MKKWKGVHLLIVRQNAAHFFVKLKYVKQQN